MEAILPRRGMALPSVVLAMPDRGEGKAGEWRGVAIEAVRVGAWRWDTRDGSILVDDTCNALWGLPGSDRPRPVLEYFALLSQEVAASFAAYTAKVVPPEEVLQDQVQIVRGPKAGCWIQWRGRPDQDEPWIINGVSFDVTEPKLVEQRRLANEERLRSAVEVGRLGLWDWDITTDRIVWSDEHFRMEGYAVGEIEPSYEAWVARHHPDDRDAAEAALREAMDAHEEFAHEFRVVHPDGSIHWLYGRGSFFYGADGKPVRMVGAMVDTTERRQWEERQKILIAELQHRTRNLLGVVRSISDRTARSSSDLSDFRTRFGDRLDALARVQGLLSRLNDVDRVTFEDLIRTELDAMEDGNDRVMLQGPADVRLRSSTVQTLALALHELATNAIKYGAIGQPQARLSITWTLEPDGPGDKPWLHIDWQESGVDMSRGYTVPAGTGQGRELIEHALPYQLEARTTYVLGPDGVRCTISIPVSVRTIDAGDHG